ncbi:MAG TPA: dockerin type I domain-containing protein [Phycisphaerales bacterium]|nr:dockerin type I domain-containing protein [Phycisphaerales bacterium]HMP38551.1 dockerin type I domain-containing protein [Phycisphaerales bacterium]
MKHRSSPARLRGVALAPLRLLCASAIASLAGSAFAGNFCLVADLDGSGAIDGADLGALLAAWGPVGGGGPADFNGDGVVDGADLGTLLSSWGSTINDCYEAKAIEPASAAPGEIVKIIGSFAWTNPLDYCAVAMTEDGEVIPFEVFSATPEALLCRVGPSRPGIGPGKVMLGLGLGSQGGVAFPPGTNGSDEVWSWEASGPGEMYDIDFTPVDAGAPISGTFYGSLVNGQLCVTISGDCPPGTKLRIWPRAHHYGDGTPNDPYIGYDCYIPCVEIVGGASELDCAQAICAAIEAAYLAHQPNPIVINCTVTPVLGGTKLTLSLPGLLIDWGMFNIEVLPDSTICGSTDCGATPDCPCDLNGDGRVDLADFIIIEKQFGQICGGAGGKKGGTCCGDLNGDGVINQIDVNLFFNNCVFGDCP